MEKMKYADYEKMAKVGDRILLGGKGILNGLDERFFRKSECFLVKGWGEFYNTEKLYLRRYKGRQTLCVMDGATDQDIILFTNEEYNKLPI